MFLLDARKDDFLLDLDRLLLETTSIYSGLFALIIKRSFLRIVFLLCSKPVKVISGFAIFIFGF
jgi:hypothetical protein